MFEECTTLMELNAARIQAAQSGKNILEVNNAYNKRRQEIVSARNNFKKLQAIYIKARPVTVIQSIPVCGRAQTPNTIILTKEGFLH